MLLMKKVGWALKGIKETFQSELNFKLEIVSGLFLVVFCILVWPIDSAELFALWIGYALVLILEMVNTALEAALARLHPERHDLIGKAKDAAAGAVFVAVLLTALIAVIILLERLGLLVFA